MSKKIMNEFDQIAKKYLKVVDTKPIHCFYERPHLLSLIPENIRGLNVLDLGCGSGWYLEKLLEKGAVVTGLDISQTMVDYSLQRLQNKATVVCADLAEPLNMFKNEQFNLLVAPLVIHYIYDWKILFGELARILKKSGYFIFSTHQAQATHFLFKLDNYYRTQKIVDHWENIGEVSYYHHSLEELVSSLLTAGFSIERWLEPLPMIEMKETAPDMYEKISRNPWFLFIRAKKIAN